MKEQKSLINHWIKNYTLKNAKKSKFPKKRKILQKKRKIFKYLINSFT